MPATAMQSPDLRDLDKVTSQDEASPLNAPEDVTHDSGRVNIIPIPSSLRFPHAAHDSDISQAPEADASQANTAVTPGVLDNLDQAHPAPTQWIRRINTERPTPAKRPTFISRPRRETHRHDVYIPGIWDSDSDDSSSSEDEPSESQKLSKTQSLKEKLSHTNSGKTGHLAGRTNDTSQNSSYSRFALGNTNYKTKGHVSKKDGRLKISLKEIGQKGYLAKALGASLKKQSDVSNHGNLPSSQDNQDSHSKRISGTTAGSFSGDRIQIPERSIAVPKLNILIMVTGSRGDIQPFLRLGKVLREDYGHRVRIATHPAFKEVVQTDSKLEFFSVGGDPAELITYMVKNPGLIPKAKTIRSGEIGKRRETLFGMFKGFWRACINTTDEETDIDNLRMMGRQVPFVADAIIANPVSFAHVHCAERLGVPLHVMFTFPTSPTQQFPHPLANIKKSNVAANYTNFMTYSIVELMQWQGLGDLINRFRVETLGLEPMSTLWAAGQIFRQKIPTTYLWSPALLPKPDDWTSEINVAGFVFLDLASSFKPPEDLVKFLDSGEPPVYIGFGSIVVDDPDHFTTLIFEAVKATGVRALVSKGWGGLGCDDVPENIFMLENTPHDWLFPRVSAVIHHGGAGTTAIGLKCGKPTMIVPFFGDQPFWGAMVAKAGAGANPIPYKKLTAQRLADAIALLLKPETQIAAQELGEKIKGEGDGAENAVKIFLNSLPLSGNHSIRCSIFSDRVAVWWLKSTHMRLSALAAEMLVRQGKIKWSELRLIRHYEYNDFEGPGEPVTGAGYAVAESMARTVHGVGQLPFKYAKILKEGHSQRGSLDLKGTDKSGHERKSIGTENATNNEAIAETERMKTTTSNQQQETLLNGVFQESMFAELTKETGRGFAKSGKAIVKAPMDISLALARGFHNAPRLYGDETVRVSRRVTGWKSGLRIAAEEFRFGVYDGWTGLWRQPYHGVKQDGTMGFMKGTAKGVGGFLLKDCAAVASLPAYTMRGMYEEVIKGRQPTKYIRRARILDGQRALVALSKSELHESTEKIRQAWKVILSLQREIIIARKKGLKGRLAVYKGKRKWKRYGLFESTEQTKKALETYKSGRTLEMDFGKMPEEKAGHNAPKDHLVDAGGRNKSGKKTDTTKQADGSSKISKADVLLINAAKEEEKTKPAKVEKGDAQALDVQV